MKVRTTHCARADHAEFELEIGDVDPSLADGLIDWLETSVRLGTRFPPYETIQFGSAVLQVRERAAQTLALFEPQPGSLPMVWIDTVADTLRTRAAQRSVAESVGLEDDLDFPHPMRTGYICDRVRRGARVGLVRNEPQEHDVGWFVMCTEPDHDHAAPDAVEAASIYEIGVQLPDFVLFAALPVNTAVLMGGDKPVEVFFDKVRQPIAAGSMLEGWHKK